MFWILQYFEKFVFILFSIFGMKPLKPFFNGRGALTIRADAGEVAGYLEEALKLRRSESTERNPLSSRSHVAGLNIRQVGI